MGDKYAKQIRISLEWSNIKKIILENSEETKNYLFLCPWDMLTYESYKCSCMFCAYKNFPLTIFFFLCRDSLHN